MLLKDVLKHKEELTELWHEVFSDEKEYIDLIFTTFGDDLTVFASFENGRAVSALYALPSDIFLAGKRFFGLYVYACATYVPFRSRGLLSNLMNECVEYSKKEGLSFLSLVPGEESLYGYYERFGFEKAMYRCSESVSSGLSGSGGALIEEIDFEEYFESRKAFLSDRFEFRGRGMQYLKACLSFSGYKFFKSDGFISAFDPENGEAVELLADHGFEGAIESACRLFNKKEFSFCSPFGKERRDFGMVLPLDEKFKAADHGNIYMNFALD